MKRHEPLWQNSDVDEQRRKAKPVPKLSPDIKAKIGQQLRVMYGEVVSQGVPDRFVEILRGLDEGNNQGPRK